MHQQGARASAGIEVPDAALLEIGSASFGREHLAGGLEALPGRSLDALDRVADGGAFRACCRKRELHRYPHIAHGLLAAVGTTALLLRRDALLDHLRQSYIPSGTFTSNPR